MQRRFRMLAIVAMSIVEWGLYIAACVMPAVDNPAPTTRDFGDITPYGPVPGIVALLLGWGGETFIAWLANPLLLTGWILLLCRKNLLAACFGAAAVAAGFTTWLVLSEPMRPLVGYYLWQASLVTFVIGALAMKLGDRRTGKEWYRRSESRGHVHGAVSA